MLGRIKGNEQEISQISPEGFRPWQQLGTVQNYEDSHIRIRIREFIPTE